MSIMSLSYHVITNIKLCVNLIGCLNLGSVSVLIKEYNKKYLKYRSIKTISLKQERRHGASALEIFINLFCVPLSYGTHQINTLYRFLLILE